MKKKILVSSIALALFGSSSCFKRDHVTASMASIYERKESLKKTVGSIIDQIDTLNIFLNDYPEVPDFLIDPKITTALGSVHGDQGARGKFFWTENVTGYHFICDDDLMYPRNYVIYMIGKIEKYRRKAIVGIHGSVLTQWPITNYYQDRHYYSYPYALEEDIHVHILGTGTIAYHSSTIQFVYNNFIYPNLDDIRCALIAQENQVPLICVQRPAGYLKDTKEAAVLSNSICQQYHNECHLHNSIINNYLYWTLYH